ncbi:hypothetical protein FisN_25Hh040 [Fistulifera solaris]|uniref:START domain-containing protein n=1 Tax=Fistulifera solaris TaxID=1519565 RepID=A0A1Z5JVI6_FISSO|nr:hypothetical protein FisN_25Hh040 [Fistulifera solaris]|eukprot:GAX18065.1 hypothetical protein FisN_25Hh040 [Fistulifera solaris]
MLEALKKKAEGEQIFFGKTASLQSTFVDSDSADEDDHVHQPERIEEVTERVTQDDDIPLFHQVEALYQEEKLLEAARLLRTFLQEESKSFHHLNDRYRHILTEAQEMENAIADIVGPPSDQWNRQSSSSSGGGKYRRPTVIYTKFDPDWKLTCRIETPIEASLLVPLLSVLNETDLYDTWIPSWRFPKIGVSRSQKLHHSGKANQLVQIVCDVPWPLRTREVIVQATAVDEIDERGYIVIRLNTLSKQQEQEHPAVHEKDPEVVRVDFEGAILFRACPLDHELRNNIDPNDPLAREPLVLVSFKMYVPLISSVGVSHPLSNAFAFSSYHLLHLFLRRFLDSKFTAVPTSLVNFCTKTVIGSMWNMFLHVAEDVRDGTRPEHAKIIAEKANLYQWIEQRSQVMLEQL